MDRFQQSIENQKRLVSNTEYFEWLYEFTKVIPKFTDTTWLYKKDSNLSEQDYKNVDLLTDFFTAIDKYHERNLLNANVEGYSCWYNIKYKETYFAIGIIVGQGATNFVTRYANYEDMLPEPFLEFEYIMENKVAPGFEEKTEGLAKLQEMVTKLCHMGTPKSAIDDIIKKIYDDKK